MRFLGFGMQVLCSYGSASTHLIVRSIASLATKAICKERILNAAKEETAICCEKGEEYGVIICGDRMWKKGFSSLYSLLTLIGYNIGNIVDFIGGWRSYRDDASFCIFTCVKLFAKELEWPQWKEEIKWGCLFITNLLSEEIVILGKKMRIDYESRCITNYYRWKTPTR